MAVGTSSRPARAQTVRRTLSDRICRQKSRGYFFPFTQAREAAYRSRFSCRSLCGQKGLGHATAYLGEAVCSMQGLLAHFRPPLAVIFRSCSLLPQQSRTQPLQIARVRSPSQKVRGSYYVLCGYIRMMNLFAARKRALYKSLPCEVLYIGYNQQQQRQFVDRHPIWVARSCLK